MKNKLVLHICCAPDEAWVVKNLKDDYDLYCFFCNPNIQPEAEYLKRMEEASEVAEQYMVKFSSDFYAPETWEQSIKGYEHTPEGGLRCDQCFVLRLQRTAMFCKKINWPYFTTVMSVSPHKNITKLDIAGERAAKECGVNYKKFNFKKKNGFLESVKLSEELNLYRQDFCGCRLSKEERIQRKK